MVQLCVREALQFCQGIPPEYKARETEVQQQADLVWNQTDVSLVWLIFCPYKVAARARKYLQKVYLSLFVNTEGIFAAWTYYDII